MRLAIATVCMALATGCAAGTSAFSQPRSPLLRDVEGYASASCLVAQSNDYLKDQGDGWAWVILQRMNGELEAFDKLRVTVRAEVAKGDMAVIPTDSGVGHDKAMPVLYCAEIIDAPAVRAAIGQAVSRLHEAYGH